MGFKFEYVVTMDRISDLSTCDELGSVFKVMNLDQFSRSQWDLTCDNIAFYAFPKVFYGWLSNLDI